MSIQSNAAAYGRWLVERLIDRAIHPSTPNEEARSCAVIAVRKIREGDLLDASSEVAVGRIAQLEAELARIRLLEGELARLRVLLASSQREVDRLRAHADLFRPPFVSIPETSKVRWEPPWARAEPPKARYSRKIVLPWPRRCSVCNTMIPAGEIADVADSVSLCERCCP